jgi:hypothetical protein
MKARIVTNDNSGGERSFDHCDHNQRLSEVGDVGEREGRKGCRPKCLN